MDLLRSIYRNIYLSTYFVFAGYVRNNYQPSDIIAFDETPVRADMVSETTVNVTPK